MTDAERRKKLDESYGPLTRLKLLRFVRRRNRSEMQTNLQFGIDLDAEKIAVHQLGDCTKVAPGICEWQTPFGVLREERGKLTLSSTSEAMSCRPPAELREEIEAIAEASGMKVGALMVDLLGEAVAARKRRRRAA